ncbi:MAG: Stp1/IreP family PP2C-type Ser/Thr phosphatase [Micrococcales bacterium]|nr:Stp1/IreP family PP2C-type Ser/Thr phosphatase [Micrococcales bacterium]MCL2668846.1 Stp1/IreP family PP2C-type Ser/Thr phosphatase [Micrococcales bacterium]
MDIALHYAARSDVGLVRANNQDSGYAGPHLLMVADGMGGHAGGDVASSVTVATMAPLDDEAHGSDEVLDKLSEALVTAKAEILARVKADPELAGMGTTVTAILRTGNKLAMVHLGDSRGYLLRDDELTQVTTDHTFVQHLVDSGKITPEEAANHPQRSVVMRVLGDFDLALTPDLSMREARPGDRWLLCSDGLSGFVSTDTISETLRSTPDVDECADRLLQLALRAGGPDNVTVIVSDVVDLDTLPDGTQPGGKPQVVGAAALSRNAPTAATDGPAARASALVAVVRSARGRTHDSDDDEDDEERPGRRRGGLFVWIVAAVAVLVVVAAGGGGYWLTQTQYYVGVDGGEVVVFRGVDASLGPLSLSHVVERTGIQADELSPYVRGQVGATIHADDLAGARLQVELIRQELPEPTTSPEPEPEPSGENGSDDPDPADGG